MFEKGDTVTLCAKSQWYKQCVDEHNIQMNGTIVLTHSGPEYKYGVKFSNGTRFSYRDIDLIYPEPVKKYSRKKLNLTMFTVMQLNDVSCKQD